jgi:hypothetical protein
MKPITAYQLKLSGILLLLFVLQGCVEKPGLWKNDQIKAGKRDDFHALNDQAFRDLKANDPKRLGLIMSRELIDNRSTSRTVELIGNRLTDYKYQLLDEYYVVNKYKDDDTIKSTVTGANRYSLYYPSAAKEMYFAFFIPKTGENKYLVTTIYAKYGYGWKLNTLDLAPYTINGKTAPELFKLAKEQYDKKYLIDAENTLALATTCLRPTSIWQYPDENEISDFYGKVMEETNKKYRFPFLLSALPLRPKVLNVYNKTTDEGTFPMIYYMTHINLKDTNAVKAENALVRKELSRMLPGIGKYSKYVFYDAFNKWPSGTETVDHFDMIDRH